MFNKVIHHEWVADSVHCWNQNVLELLSFCNSRLDELIPVTPRASADLLENVNTPTSKYKRQTVHKTTEISQKI